MTVETITQLLTPEEYLTRERAAEYKNEYLDGEMRAMTGASRRHNLIVTNTLSSLHLQLRKLTCEVYPSDMRVKVARTRRYTYPDIAVVCDTPQFEDQVRDTLLNPTVIVEVLSGSTEHYDRGDKFESYRTLDSLTDYLLAAQDRCHIEHYVRQAGGAWLLTEYNHPEQTLALHSIQCQLVLADVYEKVDFEADSVAPTNGNAGAG